MTEPNANDSAPASATAVEPDARVEEQGWLAWWQTQGSATQAAVPAFYAWAVTIAPVGWSRGAPVSAEVSAALGLAILLAGPLVERWAPTASRLVLGWGMTASAMATWGLAPEPAVASFDSARGIAGMLGWALFAFAIASPARPSRRMLASSAPLHSRTARLRSDMPLLLLGIALAVLLEVPGWREEQRDRALLVRLVALAGGLALITTAIEITVAHHRLKGEGRLRASPRLRIRVAAWLASVFLLFGAGVAYQIWQFP